MKPKKIKARRMYAPVNKSGTIGYWASLKHNVAGIAHVSVAVLDVSDVDALLEMAGPIIQEHVGYFNGWHVNKEEEATDCREAARDVFMQLGIIPKARAAKSARRGRT